MESHGSSRGASPTADSPVNAAHHPRPAKAHPQIKIEPTCLVFPPPHFGRCIQNAISIYNVSKQPCVFKMRSQNPERYVAKPHVAIVAPESARRIFVTLRDMNTLGTKNLPEDTNDRFRISLRLYNPSTVDASLAPKELWNVLQQRGAKVDHEQDLVSYFTKMDTPVGGLVTFFPPTYIPVTPHPTQKGEAAPVANGGGAGAAAGGAGVAKRGLAADMNAAAQKNAQATGSAAQKRTSAKDGDGDALKGKAAGGNKMPALWVGVAVAAMVVVSLAIGAGVMLRGGAERVAQQTAAQPRQHQPAPVSSNAAPSAAHGHPHEAPAAPQADEARMRAQQAEEQQQRQQRERARRAAEAQRMRDLRVQQKREQQAQREAEEREAARVRAAEEEAQRLRMQREEEERAYQAQQQQQQRQEEEARLTQQQQQHQQQGEPEEDEAELVYHPSLHQQESEEQLEAHRFTEPHDEHAEA